MFLFAEGLKCSIIPLANLSFAFAESQLAGKIIVLVLFGGSIFAWTIMISKFFELRQAQRESDRFITAFRKEDHPVSLFLKHRKYNNSPIYQIYWNGCSAVGLELDVHNENVEGILLDPNTEQPQSLSTLQIETVRNMAERTVADQALLLENNMGFLATAVSASPFLGLLGTVWGVMEAFSGMAITGSPTLAAVAPGISGALLTTVVGLLVALPSAIGYNTLSNRIRKLCVQMDNFSQEFSAEIGRAFRGE